MFVRVSAHTINLPEVASSRISGTSVAAMGRIGIRAGSTLVPVTTSIADIIRTAPSPMTATVRSLDDFIPDRECSKANY